MKNFSTTLKLTLTSFLTVLMLTAVHSQVKQDTLWAAKDLTLGSGTGQELGDFKDRNLGADASMQICNFDDNESLMSYFEGWAQFDLTGLPALIPDGEDILYTEIVELVRSSRGELNFNDALIALSCRHRGISFIASFDRDFDNVAWLRRVAKPDDLH